mgnify:CR=1 FL=1
MDDQKISTYMAEGSDIISSFMIRSKKHQCLDKSARAMILTAEVIVSEDQYIFPVFEYNISLPTGA